MDYATSLLFGEFPRSVGMTMPDVGSMELNQFVVNNEGEFELFLDEVRGKRNGYASISSVQPVFDDHEHDYRGNKLVLDKVFYDFDSHAKTDRGQPGRWDHPRIDPEENERSVIERMRNDDDLLDDILGPIAEDAAKLAKASLEDGIPTVGVFSGFGIHVYQLFKPKANPKDNIKSISRKYIEELNLASADAQVVGDIGRITRIPNLPRIDGGNETPLVTVPLSGRELVEITPEQLMDVSTSPRRDVYEEPGERPEMPLYEKHLKSRSMGQNRMRGTAVNFESAMDEDMRQLLKDLFQMPCVYERAVQPNPAHPVRYQIATMLFNLGYSVEDALDFIRQLGWIDFDEEVTRYMLESIRDGNSAEKGCKRMMFEGLCQRADEPQKCPAYGWRGGERLW